MKRITPFLWFNTEAEDAARYYCSIFKNSKILDLTRYPAGSPGPEGSVMTVKFVVDGQELVAINGGPAHQLTPAFSLVVNCKNQKEVDAYWDKLTDGGKEVACGWVTDKFGVSWQVVPEGIYKLWTDKNRGRVERAMQAMMQMKKLDLPALLAAADGKEPGAAKSASSRPNKATKSTARKPRRRSGPSARA